MDNSTNWRLITEEGKYYEFIDLLQKTELRNNFNDLKDKYFQ